MCPHLVQQTGMASTSLLLTEHTSWNGLHEHTITLIFHFKFSSIDKFVLHITRQHCALDANTNGLSVNVIVFTIFYFTCRRLQQGSDSWPEEMPLLMGSNFIDNSTVGKCWRVNKSNFFQILVRWKSRQRAVSSDHATVWRTKELQFDSREGVVSSPKFPTPGSNSVGIRGSCPGGRAT